MLRCFISLFFILSIAASASADPGACLRLDGVWVAPFTDPTDPACGEDCPPEPPATGCERERTCTLSAQSPAFAAPGLSPDAYAQGAPRPGPLCIDSQPQCVPYDLFTPLSAACALPCSPRPGAIRAPAQVLLTQRGPRISTRHAPLQRTDPPDPPPPRAHERRQRAHTPPSVG